MIKGLIDLYFCNYRTLLPDGKILSGHDVSDGGLVVCLLEMAFAGNRSLNVDIQFGPGMHIKQPGQYF